MAPIKWGNFPCKGNFPCIDHICIYVYLCLVLFVLMKRQIFFSCSRTICYKEIELREFQLIRALILQAFLSRFVSFYRGNFMYHVCYILLYKKYNFFNSYYKFSHNFTNIETNWNSLANRHTIMEKILIKNLIIF